MQKNIYSFPLDDETAEITAQEYFHELLGDYDAVSDKFKICKLYRLYVMLFGIPQCPDPKPLEFELDEVIASANKKRETFSLGDLLEFNALHPLKTVQFVFDVLGVKMKYRMRVIRRTEITVVRLFDFEIGETEETGRELTLGELYEDFSNFLVINMELSN